MKNSRLAAFALLILFATAQLASAQGVLINVNTNDHVRLPRPIIIYPPYPYPRPRPIPRPVPQQTYKIKELSVQGRIQDQVAKVQVSQSFVNTGSRQMEVCFVFPLPYDGAVDQLTLLVDGKEFGAKLLSAKEARKLYEDIVRKNKDPALLEWMGTGMFKTSVFPVPAGAERKVTLRYSQLCRKNQGLTELLFPLSTAKYTSHPVEKVSIRFSIESSEKIKNVYSPTHSISIKRPDNKHATISFEEKNKVPGNDFRLFYDTGKQSVGARLLSFRPDKDEDGFFMMLASPEIKAKDEQRPKKTVVFVVDRSGSMSGKKIEQAKDSLKFVLNNLREGDLFNIVAYDSEVESFRPELQKYNDETRKAALGFVEGIYAGGSTNISGALTSALGFLKDTSRPNFIIFLTDGLPTAGETNEAKIVTGSKHYNDVRARMFTFGVGYDVNSRLLDKLARENFGQSEYVRPDEDIEESVSRLYNRIGAPVMTDVQITFDVEGVRTQDGPAINCFYPKKTYDLFAGEQLVIVGRYHTPGDAKVVIRGKVGDEKQKLDFPGKFVNKSNDESNAFIEKIWAMRRVGEIIDEIDLNGKNKELIKELVTLATKHGILTPYTSFIADENNEHRDIAGNALRATKRLDELKKESGVSGFAQRRAKGAYQRANNAADAEKAASAAPSFGAIQQGLGGGRGVGAPGASSADAKEATNITRNVRNLGRKNFLRKGDYWIDSTIKKEDENKNVITINRFSEEYFDIIRNNGKDVAKYLQMEEPTKLQIGKQIYLVK